MFPPGLTGQANGTGHGDGMQMAGGPDGGDKSQQQPPLFDLTPGSEMWYLPPGAAFFQNINDTSVAMTAEGVNVGGIDLLDFMAYGGNPLDGGGPGGY